MCTGPGFHQRRILPGLNDRCCGDEQLQERRAETLRRFHAPGMPPTHGWLTLGCARP